MIKKIEGVGSVRFPDSMSEKDIKEAIEGIVSKKEKPQGWLVSLAERLIKAIESIKGPETIKVTGIPEPKITVEPEIRVAAPQVTVSPPSVTIQAPAINVPQAQVIVHEPERKPVNVRFEIERDQYGSIVAITARDV